MDVNDIHVVDKKGTPKFDKVQREEMTSFKLPKSGSENQMTKEKLQKEESDASSIFNPNAKGANIVAESDISRFDLDMGMSDIS